MDIAQGGNSAASETPAEKVIRLLGVKAIAWKCNLTTDAVYKWPKRSGGRVPSKYQPQILELAKAENVPLNAADVIGVAA